jgi:potassium-transporting ATPase KdpC subunit
LLEGVRVMLTEIRTALRPALVLLLLMTVLTGILYPLAITGVAQVAFSRQANGTLIKSNGTVTGSELIGQNFTSARYFHSRPSAAGKGYDASGSAASNLAPSSKDLLDRIRADVAAQSKGSSMSDVPADLVTTSASGLDPHITPEAALFQVRRIAAARSMDQLVLEKAVEDATEYPLLGLIGEPRVNVLLLNRQIDKLVVTPVR